MVERTRLIGQVFRAIANDETDGHHLWNLLEEIAGSSEGLVYMTFGGETPQSLAKKLDRPYLLKLIQLHDKLIQLRTQF